MSRFVGPDYLLLLVLLVLISSFGLASFFAKVTVRVQFETDTARFSVGDADFNYKGITPVDCWRSGDDSVNIRTALWLSNKYPRTKILARCFRRSTFANQISGECDFEVFSTAELLLTGMHSQWFGEIKSS